MYKSPIFLFTLIIALSLMAVGYVKWSDTDNRVKDDLVYNVDSRYMTTITKENLDKARSVLDIVPKVATGWWKVSFQTVTVAVLDDGEEIREVGEEKTLNDAQIKLLQSTDYSSDFYLKARGTDIHPETGQIEDYTYYLTVVPEKEAEYASGQEALISYIKENTKEETAIIKQDKLKSGKVEFTVTKKGTISDVKLLSTSGYPSVDKTLVDLISDLPEKWIPAESANGEKVDQTLVFIFGQQGC